MKVKIVPDELQFIPPMVDGAFWKEFAALLPYLTDPSDLVDLYKKDFEAYAKITAGYLRFVMETEKELDQKGHLIETELPDIM
jgi:hypothetical protein